MLLCYLLTQVSFEVRGSHYSKSVFHWNLESIPELNQLGSFKEEEKKGVKSIW